MSRQVGQGFGTCYGADMLQRIRMRDEFFGRVGPKCKYEGVAHNSGQIRPHKAESGVK